jgi:hypothetical protein
MIYRSHRQAEDARALQISATNQSRSPKMFTKTMIALLTALVLSVAYVPAQAQTQGRNCMPSTTEEGTLSAYPAWRVC